MDVGKVACIETERLKNTLAQNGIRCLQDNNGKMRMWFRPGMPRKKAPAGRVIPVDFAKKQ